MNTRLQEKQPDLPLSTLQTLWLKELGVTMLWGHELQATAIQVATSPEVTLIKRSSPEGRTKSGRATQEQMRAMQSIQKGFEQQAHHARVSTSAQLSSSLPIVQAGTWEALTQEIQQQYLQWGWVKDPNEILVGQAGKIPSDILIIEEMPGADDALEGQVFAGASGQLLSNMLAPLGLCKEEVGITSLFKFHARDKNISIQHAIPFLQVQIQLLQPKCIWLLGARVAQSFLAQESCTIDSLRTQEWFYPLSDTQKIPVIVSHHPSLVLVNAMLKADIWADLQRLAVYI